MLWAGEPANWFPRFKALAVYNPSVEEAHQRFAQDALQFLKDMTVGEGFVLDTTSNFNDFNDEKLRTYQLVISLDDNPGHNKEQREAFQRYMENGGGWLGFHAAAYNDRSTNWPWFVGFLGGGVFSRNNWPPMPAKLLVDDPRHPVAKAMPATFIAPINEWYQWEPSPRKRKNIKVLVTLSPENYPIGLKDIVSDGDLPVVWTNTDYRMIYLNMGHGDRIFSDPTQNHLFFNALKWVIATDKKGNVFEK
ncbi:ThuA domain-containing protein [Parabacteroides distasonis]|uniref:ThuA domain-containing protein n=1 Tax=Parabacteroides distasonis TaxID=823 RepID=UPI003B51FEE7